jgi:hypothetical protein
MAVPTARLIRVERADVRGIRFAVMAWNIAEGPRDAPWSGRDAVGWGWILTNDRGERQVVMVWVSGTAMSIADEYLPAETAAARATRGRSEVERLLNDAILPREVMLHTAGRTVDPGEAGWWVELRGDPNGLDALRRLFPAGEINVVARGGQHFLRASAFAELVDEHEVRLRAAVMVREAAGAAEIAGEHVGNVEVGAVQRID